MNLESAVRIGVIGDYREENRSHVATAAAFQHAACALDVAVQVSWLPTAAVQLPAVDLDSFDGLLCAPGSPYASMDNALGAIRHARENDQVFLGTCGGFQHAVIEFARNVLEVTGAEHEETSPDARTLFIRRMSCSLVGSTGRVRIRSDSRLAAIFGREQSVEQFWCSFGVNPEFSAQLDRGGLRISATDDGGAVRAVELPDHRFFIGTLFIPQLSSTPMEPHPIMIAFLNAAAEARQPGRGSDSPQPITDHGPRTKL